VGVGLRSLTSKYQHAALCYEAGAIGYLLYWQLTKLGVRCEVVAPTLIPVSRVIASRPIGVTRKRLARC
jgi:transposase